MKTPNDPARAAQTAAMLDHLLAHYETFCEGRRAGRVPESFMQELHELYYWRTGCTDTATAWQAPLPPQEPDPGDNWYDRHIGPRWWWLTDVVLWRRLRAHVVMKGLIWYARLWCVVSKIRLAGYVLRTVWIIGRPADPRPAAVLLLAGLWPVIWLLAHR